MRRSKTSAESYSEQTHIIMPKDINPAGRLFGGKILEWIDIVAALVARRHADMNVTTARIENLSFAAPAYLNDILILQGKITFAGRRSMEVRVDSYVEGVGRKKTLVNTAYLIMVAVTDSDDLIEIPDFEPITNVEKEEYLSAKKRYEDRKWNKL